MRRITRALLTLNLALCAAIMLAGCARADTVAPLPAASGVLAMPTAQVFAPPAQREPIMLPTSLPVPQATAAPLASTTPAPVQALRDGPGGLPYPLSLTRLNFGVVGHLYYTNRTQAMSVARSAGFEWFRQQIHWRDIEDRSGQYFWGELDNIVADVNASGSLLMLNVTRAPSWHTANGGDGLPADPATLGRFVGALAERYRGRVHASLIWNEQNLAYENCGQVNAESPGHFVECMIAAYNAVKAVDPGMLVVAGAPASTATNDPSIAMDTLSYLKGMYSYRDGIMGDYFDIQALHPGGSANPPETLWPDQPSGAAGWSDDPSFYFRHIENQRKVMEEFGLGEHQVWITEFGWATPNSSPGYEFGNLVSYDNQRDYIVGALRWSYEKYPWVSNMFLWNLNFTVLQAENGKDPQNEQGSFSIVNADWSPRPAYLGAQQAISEIRAQQGR